MYVLYDMVWYGMYVFLLCYVMYVYFSWSTVNVVNDEDMAM